MSTTEIFRHIVWICLVVTTSACLRTPPDRTIEGTAAQAILARNAMIEGSDFITALGLELAAVVNRFQPVHAATQAFIFEPPVLPVPSISETQVSDWYGTHSETSAGVFSSITSTTPGIHIELLNGIDIKFVFNSDPLDPSVDEFGNIDNFRLEVTSNNRSLTTPLLDSVNISLDYNVLEVNQSATNILPAGMETEGYIGFTRNGPAGATEVIYDVKRVLGSGDNIAGATVNSGEFIRLTDITRGAGGKEWQSINRIAYVQPEALGAWIGNSASQIYLHDTVNYSGEIIANGMLDYISTKTVNYTAKGDVIYTSGSGPVRVGILSGGPYSCDLSNPAAPIGSGTDIVIKWNDETIQTIMPNANFTCAQVIAQ